MEYSIILLSVVEVVLLIIAVLDLIKRKFKNLAFAVVWLFIVLVIPVIGPMLYLFLKGGMSAGRPKSFNPMFQPGSNKGK
ncbi:MAG TPA: PLD nuclease N-terminal domain-containing protein [Prolixibacteraceae bacterium]|nr:PLD nuclease N-terminal domain-containing protein [Prolixibacteraceae bacterium]